METEGDTIRTGAGALAFISLGANLGNTRQHVIEAFHVLAPLSAAPLLKSSLWQTAPVDCPPGSPLFVNAVAGLAPFPHETPESLLLKLQRIEKQFGRMAKTVLNEPRPLDLDLVTFGNRTSSTDFLVLPHPRAHLRRFVLEPLKELAPDLVLPGQQKTVSELLRDLVTDEPAPLNIGEPQ